MKKKNDNDSFFLNSGVIFFVAVFCGGFLFSCKEKKAAQLLETHQGKLEKADGSAIYIDSVSNKTVMKSDGMDTGATRFHSYRISMADSSITDQKQEMERQRYYDYEMQNEWRALVNGDSIAPVFFHPLVKKSELLKEFVAVFELPAGMRPDTFIYKDSRRREINMIVLNRK